MCHQTALTIVVPFQAHPDSPFFAQALRILRERHLLFVNLRFLYLVAEEAPAVHRLFRDVRLTFPMLVPAPTATNPRSVFNPWDLVDLQMLPNLHILEVDLGALLAPTDPDLFWGIQWMAFRSLRELRVRGIEATRRHDGYYRGPRFRDIQHLDRFVWDASQWTVPDFGTFFEYAEESSQLFTHPMTIEFHSLNLTDDQLKRIRRVAKKYFPNLDLFLFPQH